jgi:hypothetical protein
VPRQRLAKFLSNFLEAFHVNLGLFEMLFEAGLQLLVRRSLGHFRKRLQQLVFGAVEIFNLVKEKIFEAFSVS